MQKFSFNKEEERAALLGGDQHKRPYVKQWRWWCGMVLVVLGAIGDFVCFALAPQSIVTPMGSFTLVTNVIFAHFWLGEALAKRDLVGTALILTGATVAVAFGDHTETCYTLDELMALYARPSVVAYIVVVIATLAFFYWVVKTCEKMLRDRKPGQPPPPEYRRFTKLHPLAYAALAGTFGANTCLFAKSTAEIIKTSVAGENQMVYGATYVILAFMFLCIALEQHWLATGLVHFDALYVVPVFQSFFIGVSVIGGGVYFDELGSFSATQWFFFPLGVCMCLSGVLILSARMAPPTEEDKPIFAQADLTSSERLEVIQRRKSRRPTVPLLPVALGGEALGSGSPVVPVQGAAGFAASGSQIGDAELGAGGDAAARPRARSKRRSSFLKKGIHYAHESAARHRAASAARARPRVRTFSFGGSMANAALISQAYSPELELLPGGAAAPDAAVPAAESTEEPLRLAVSAVPALEPIPGGHTPIAEESPASSPDPDDAAAAGDAADEGDADQRADDGAEEAPAAGAATGGDADGGDAVDPAQVSVEADAGSEAGEDASAGEAETAAESGADGAAAAAAATTSSDAAEATDAKAAADE